MISNATQKYAMFPFCKASNKIMINNFDQSNNKFVQGVDSNFVRRTDLMFATKVSGWQSFY